MRTPAALMTFFLLTAVCLPGAARAHHGWTSYDASRTVVIKASVAELTWGNPHSMMWVMHEGNRVEVYLAPITRMVSRGLTQDMLPAGKEIQLEAYASTRNPGEFRAERIIVDGKTIELR